MRKWNDRPDQLRALPSRGPLGTKPPYVGSAYGAPDITTQLKQAIERIASARVIAKAIIDARQFQKEVAMKEKMRALREYMGDNRKKLSESIDEAMGLAQEVYPQAHEAVATQHDEVSGIKEELLELRDEANQAMGGNRPPKGGSSGSGQSSDKSEHLPKAPTLSVAS